MSEDAAPSTRKIIHVDMDAFYASVEQRDNPELRGKPVAVGGSAARGVVAAASYEARAFGVRSALPSVTAKRRCPDLIFVPPRFDVYRAVSAQIREIFSEHTDLIEPLSLDEAYLDVTDNKQGIPVATEIASLIRARIKDVTVKTGSTGTLCFVSVDHEIATKRGPAVRERHDIVYRQMPTDGKNAAPAKPAQAPAAAHRETHMADPVLLFRYSAVTFNSHRIHYDRDYVTKEEGYPGLIVHGPLQASLLVDFGAKLHGSRAPKTFTYRGLQPLFDGSEFSVNASATGATMELWTANNAGAPTMKGTATW